MRRPLRRLVIVRPEPGASESAGRARAIGLEPVVMPLFAIEPIAWQVPEASDFDALLLTSANAVRYGGLERLLGLPAYAVGEATAAAALEAGFKVAASGEAGVERLLTEIPPALRLLHLCGEQRIEPNTRQSVTAVTVYRSAELPMPEQFRSICGQVAAVHSPRSGRRLAELADRAGVDRSTVRIAAISPAAASAAGPGWERCEAAEAPGEAALLALAARLCKSPSET